MTRRQLVAAATTLMVFVAVVVVSPGAGAQPDEITVAPGPWHGTVSVGGLTEASTTLSDLHDNTVIVAAPKSLPIELVANAKGEITSGTMTVAIGWEKISEGATTTGGNTFPYDVISTQQQSGTLTLSGTIERLVAEGSLEWSTSVIAGGDFVEEVSGTETVEVMWVFQATESICALLTGSLVEATGISLMTSVLRPVEGDVVSNSLRAVSRIWPAAREGIDVEDITEDAIFLNEQAQLALASPMTTPAELRGLVQAAEDLRERLALLEFCEMLPLGFLVPEGGVGWLASLLQDLLFRALETPDAFNAIDFVRMLNIGVRGGAFSSGTAAALLVGAFEAVLGGKLDQAIAAADLKAIEHIAFAASQYNYTELYDKAVTAYTELR